MSSTRDHFLCRNGNTNDLITNEPLDGGGGENTTPITTVRVIEGVFSDEQKTQLIDKIIEAQIVVYGEGMRDKTWVIIEEVKPADWASGGQIAKP